jgi:hypothetical protein
MTKSLLITVICTALNLLPMEAQSHVSEPAVNLGDTSFLDGIGGPGLLAEEIGDGSHSGKVEDSEGHVIPDAPAINSLSGLTHIAWLSNRRVIGGWYGVEVVGVAAHVNAGANGTAAGWGDTTVSPFILQWSEQKVGSVRIDQRVVLDLDLPTGEYQPDSQVNLNSHAFTVHPYYAITAFPRKNLETSWRIHYLWNGTNDAHPSDTPSLSTQAGQAIHFNATTGYGFPHGLWVGANGYFLKQVTAPRVNGLSIANSPEQVGAIGPGAVWASKRYLLYANAYHEFGAENRPEGNKVVLRIQWILGK